ncbi:4-(cytidine 5'-diphospho)-2-C-methyl-D-erythritol kinase [Corynebacterium timonense]|uniref:4-diphosphocytidyl-2-C-methyl-D-erythritol kinase n=1 Tax=Corynebacterium timonense TaxID=441500 RepID=A0A1H1QYQ0_9CORY|nr:4-(cytidine 5'-diphospho)-2-C-methyl-D-erythritol kinase [Corynebacterium timonense]SDS28502.1 4-diphosphocytidyl-2-C-methyl-D-erythritol kinase [Corynebacterium timonense]
MKGRPREFSASAPGKVNLHLGVGEARRDGYHELVTVFQAVQRRETVRLLVDPALETSAEGTVVQGMSTFFGVAEPEEDIDGPANLAWRAVDAVVAEYRRRYPGAALALPRVKVVVEKDVFVAGGMAGGSADAAAALVAANDYLGSYGRAPLEEDALVRLARSLGADVPFCLVGGTALGTGRGDELVEMLARGQYHWVFVNPRVGLPTGEAFSLLDDLRHDNPAFLPRLDTSALSRALLSADPEQLARALHNDLEPAAVRMRPQLAALLRRTGELGLRAIVSGSGPTVAVLCRDDNHTAEVLSGVRDGFPGYEAFATTGPAPGAQLLAGTT